MAAEKKSENKSAVLPNKDVDVTDLMMSPIAVKLFLAAQIRIENLTEKGVKAKEANLAAMCEIVGLIRNELKQ